MMESFLDVIEPLQGVLLALGLGLLIGIERGWSRRHDADGARVAGIRTFALLGLAGGMAGEAGKQFSPLLTAVIVAAAAAALLIGYIHSMRRHESVSATTTIVGIITLGIGVFAATGQGVLASVLAAATTVILSLRRQLHRRIGNMSEAEVQAIARFALISIAILPLLPDQAYGPYEAWNPRQLWMVVVLVSGLSFAGYVAAKWLGASRGTIVTSAVGAIVSSTAVTAFLATRLRNRDGSDAISIAGIAIASTVMFLRILVLVALLVPYALPTLSLLLGPPAIFSVVYTAWLLRRNRGTNASAANNFKLNNPFDIAPALLLAGLVMLLSVLSRWALDHFGDEGLATVLTVSGLFDADSAVITMHGLPEDSLNAKVAGLILSTPVIANTLFKAGIIMSIAGFSAGWRAALPLVISVGIALFAIPLLIL